MEMETTNTEIIVRMVEAGLGLSIVPLLPGGAVTRGESRNPAAADAIRPIQSGVLTRRGEQLSPASVQFRNLSAARCPKTGPRPAGLAEFRRTGRLLVPGLDGALLGALPAVRPDNRSIHALPAPPGNLTCSRNSNIRAAPISGVGNA